MAIGVQVWSTTASQNSTSDTNINWAEGMAPSQVNDSARAEMASVAKWRDDNNGTLVTGGSTTAYTVTSNQVEGALTSGYTIAVQFHATNDSSATLNVDGLGAKPLQVTAGTNLAGGEFPVGNTFRFTYSTTGTGQWIANGADALGSQPNIVTSVNITNAAVTFAKIQNLNATTLIGNATTSAAVPTNITLGTNLSFSGTTLNAGNNTPVISVFTSTGTATWQSTTQGGNFPLYLRVLMAAGGGGGGAQTTNSGANGTDSSFASWTVIHGTGGGTNSGNGGTGGSGGANGTGTLVRRVAGSNGTAGATLISLGGASALGGAGVSSTNNAAGTNAAANSGSGGGGGIGSGNAGAAGAAGEFVEFIVTSPSTSYSYTVGGGGAGGSAGGQAGGNGAAGIVVVEAYWQ